MMIAAEPGAAAERERSPLIGWLLGSALPYWAEHGVDRRQGGVFERIMPDGTPIEEPRRARLVARQIYCFATGAELGWDGPAADIVAHGLDFLLTRLVRADG
ncbi:MAG: AGE family epimerase/isomerase, partial [Rhizobiales bacterium]|nr:AGE family epimerase/isomerase [Hyphomicrobiales bacterium]